jgi:3-oxoacyl-[acyl-carrier protein] reductase
MKLRGTSALLTGAAGGLGHYIARALAAEGVNLALNDLPSASVDDLVEELRPRGVTVESLPADLTDTAGLETLARHAEEAIGPLDILVNNAGIEYGGGFGHQTREELETIAAVNLLAPMELTRVVLPGMLERRRGQIVTSRRSPARADFSTSRRTAPPSTAWWASRTA